MTTDQAAALPEQQPSPNFQFGLVPILYVYALLGVTLATFGCFGIGLAPAIILFWGYVYNHRSRPRALARACLMLLVCSCLICLLLPGISFAREAARRAQCTNNIKQLAFALHNYHDAYGQFPPAFVPDQDGRPIHSWRVLILPFIEQQGLYQQYEFAEPWDGPNNRRLLSQIPSLYRCPSDVRTGRGVSEWTDARTSGFRTQLAGSAVRRRPSPRRFFLRILGRPTSGLRRRQRASTVRRIAARSGDQLTEDRHESGSIRHPDVRHDSFPPRCRRHRTGRGKPRTGQAEFPRKALGSLAQGSQGRLRHLNRHSHHDGSLLLPQ